MTDLKKLCRQIYLEEIDWRDIDFYSEYQPILDKVRYRDICSNFIEGFWCKVGCNNGRVCKVIQKKLSYS